MKFILLKFNHGVEIGARLAYLGHYKRTNDINIKKIADDELEHRTVIKTVLNKYNKDSSLLIDGIFYIIGNIIKYTCLVSPLSLLNFVARILERFAVFNYKKISKLFPEETELFLDMAKVELEHDIYFSKGNE